MSDPDTKWPITWEGFLNEQELERFTANYLQLAALRTMFSDPTVPLSEIAEQIAAESAKLRENTPGASDSKLWRTLADGIKQLTDYNDLFVELFLELAKVNGLIAYWEWWTEWAFECMFFFYCQKRGMGKKVGKLTLNSIVEDFRSADPYRDAARQGWININCFCAKVSRYRNAYPVLDNRRRIKWIRNILEIKFWEDYNPDDYADECEEVQAHKRELHDIKALDALVPAAGVWFIVDAQAVYDLEANQMGPDGEFWKSDWQGEAGFSKERFAYWRDRFEWISGVDVLAEQTRTVAKEVVVAMENIEERK